MNNTKQEIAFNGQCAFAVSLGKLGVASDVRYFTVKDEKKYLFLSPIAKILWFLIPGCRVRAEKNWASKS